MNEQSLNLYLLPKSGEAVREHRSKHYKKYCG
nr:MAG TPA: hypothetical protein [Caudoviricetes sp.]